MHKTVGENHTYHDPHTSWHCCNAALIRTYSYTCTPPIDTPSQLHSSPTLLRPLHGLHLIRFHTNLYIYRLYTIRIASRSSQISVPHLPTPLQRPDYTHLLMLSKTIVWVRAHKTLSSVLSTPLKSSTT